MLKKKGVENMLTKNIKYPYTKFFFDVVGVISSIGLLLLLIFNSYANFESSGSSELGIEWTGNTLISGAILIGLIVVCACVSFILKKIKQ
ncbi:hypothetical protein [Staphylococcus pasteuri]|uniref:hypothetical protein n=2 Tax=Staphylococcus pasteuri TaxID=45972 RepID=UPI002FBEDC82